MISTTFTTRTLRSETGSQVVRGSEGFRARHVAGAGHHHVGIDAPIAAGPFPDAESFGAVLYRRVHVEPLQLGLLAGDDNVDVVAAAQAVIGHREQGICIGRQVDPNDLGLFVDRVIDETRILVGEPVVILAPHVRTQEVIERRDRRAPRQVAGNLEPLGVLIEHRIDHVHERFVGAEQPVPPGEQIAFQPAQTSVLAQDFHHRPSGARWSSSGSVSATHARSVTSNSPPNRLELVSSGPMTRKFRASWLSFIMSRRNVPITRVASPVSLPGALTLIG